MVYSLGFLKETLYCGGLPSPRLILFPSEIHISRRLGRQIRKPLFSVTFDTAFKEVIDSCASIRQNMGEDTWITDEMKNAYSNLHEMGYAHSVECWENGVLAGGLYGVSLGRVFFGESMFSAKPNASKIALVALSTVLQKREYRLIDCQMTTSHLQRFGAKEISGTTFSKYLQRFITVLLPDGNWKNERFP